ncbi:hypothetical protein L3X38_003442 [Prunus dulcis]|uniref:Uncharacterized protein n=1 Tax=Prunus dulcis TaxID=3755 RepID=A0AAD5F1X2_PRUDU|nr:hypothetical protein L3X38_003442 [Prunus dulcis]
MKFSIVVDDYFTKWVEVEPLPPSPRQAFIVLYGRISSAGSDYPMFLSPTIADNSITLGSENSVQILTSLSASHHRRIPKPMAKSRPSTRLLSAHSKRSSKSRKGTGLNSCPKSYRPITSHNVPQRAKPLSPWP